MIQENVVLSLKNVVKTYSGAPALNGVSFDIKGGRIVGLLGPNGSGKTTIIKIITGLLVPDEGEVKICGLNVGAESKALVSYLPDKNFLAQWMTVEQVLTYYSDFFADFNIQKAREMLANLKINSKAKIKTLSKGTQEKVCLILTMSREAKLYVLDEPIAGVDPAAREYILRTIVSNFGEDSSLIISTHLIEDIEQVLNDVLFICNGDIVLSADVDSIREKEGKSVDKLFREVFRC